MPKAKTKLTDQDRIEIVEKYKTGNYTCSELGKEYNRAANSINSMLRTRGIPIVNHKSLRRIYTLDEHYFDIIDKEEKAYFLGFLYADGCVPIKNYNITLGLQEKDKEILEKFSVLLGSNKPLSFKDNSIKHPTWQNIYILHISSEHIKDKLIELGCTPQKTHNLQFPKDNQIPQRLMKDFVRGFFDGDGSFSLYFGKDKCWRLTSEITGNFDFLNGLQKWLEEFNFQSSIHKVKRYSDNIVSWGMTGREQVLNFLSFLYDDSKIFLKRKYDKFLKIKDFLISNNLEKNIYTIRRENKESNNPS